MKNKSEIKYFVNPEKKVCVAKLSHVNDDIASMLIRTANKNGISLSPFWDNDYALICKIMKDIPNSITGRATCADMDEFNEEVGCAIARARLLEKLYQYRAIATYRCAEHLKNIVDTFGEKANYYSGRAEDYADEAIMAFSHE